MRVLLWVYLDTHFRELFRVAEALLRHGHQPEVVFVYRYPNLEVDIERCRQAGVDFRDEAPRPPPPTDPALPVSHAPAPPPVSLAYRIARGVYHRLRRLFAMNLTELAGLTTTVAAYRERRNKAERLIRAVQPRLLVLPEDNVEYDTAALIRAASRAGIPSVIIPYTIADALEPAEAYYEYRPFWFDDSRRIHRFVRWAFPSWVFVHRGRALWRLPWESVLAMEWLGLAPALPWILNSGSADRIALESDALRDYYLRLGLPERQLAVTGGLRHDALARHAAALPPGRRRTVLCALPPDQRPESRPGCEFATYAELVQAWAESLARVTDADVVVNPHPRIPLDSLRHLEALGVRLVPGDIAALLPACDLFVASVSATICMALALGKPVLNWDVYLFRYVDFANEPAVRTVETRAEFERSLTEMSAPENFPELSAARECARSGRWGRIDGGAERRLLQLFADLA